MVFACAAALNQVCEDSCRYYFGLSWWVTWFELLILLGTIPVAVSATASKRTPYITALLTAHSRHGQHELSCD